MTDLKQTLAVLQEMAEGKLAQIGPGLPYALAEDGTLGPYVAAMGGIPGMAEMTLKQFHEVMVTRGPAILAFPSPINLDKEIIK